MWRCGSALQTARVERAKEAASGFEPLHRGFADLSLNHLGTPPRGREDPSYHRAVPSGKVDAARNVDAINCLAAGKLIELKRDARCACVCGGNRSLPAHRLSLT